MISDFWPSDDQGVSPVVGVLLVVAVTVALSVSVGVFVFDLGDAISDTGSDQSMGVRTTHANGEVSVQVISGDADELQILVNGSVAKRLDSPRAGDDLTASAHDDADISIVSVTDGDSTLVSTSNSATQGVGPAEDETTETPDTTETPEPNTDPSASAGADPILVESGDTIAFDGSGSEDTDGDSLSYNWEFGDGETSTDPSPTHTYAESGEYTAVLTVDDGNGGTATDSITITVESPVPETSLLAYWTFADESDATTLSDASGNGRDGAISGATYTSDTAFGTALSFDGDDDKVEVSNGAVTEADGFTASLWVNVPDTTVDSGVLIGTWEDGDVDEREWMLALDEGEFRFDTSHDGTYTGDNKVTATAETGWVHLVAVYHPDGENRLYVNTTRHGITRATDGLYTESPYPLAFAHAPAYGGNERHSTVTMREGRLYDQALDDTGVDDLFEDGKAVLDAENGNPTASATSDAPVIEGETVSFDASSSSDPDSDSLSYSWQFGDGSTETGATPTHSYSDDGEYDVTLTVDDGNGGTDTTTFPVVIKDSTESGLAAHWAFDDDTDTTAYDSAGSNDGSISGATYVAGVNGNALAFDGESHVRVPDAASLNFGATDSFTITGWIRATGTDNQALVAKRPTNNQGYIMHLQTDTGALGLKMGDGSNTKHVIGDPVNDGDWHHVAATIDRDTQTLTLYIDGEESNSGDISEVGDLSSTTDVYLGTGSNNNYHSSGDHDEFRVYSRVLTAEEVATLHSENR